MLQVILEHKPEAEGSPGQRPSGDSQFVSEMERAIKLSSCALAACPWHALAHDCQSDDSACLCSNACINIAACSTALTRRSQCGCAPKLHALEVALAQLAPSADAAHLSVMLCAQMHEPGTSVQGDLAAQRSSTSACRRRQAGAGSAYCAMRG